MSAPPDRAKSVFLDALEIESADDRRAYLDAQCSGDATLRQEVEDLLRHHEQIGGFLESAPPGLAAAIEPRLIAEQPGQTVGRYTLLEEIGEGGMGVVYLAEQQEPVRRKVALKIIKPGMDTRAVVARFEAERQALALMEHPNIARVLDGGATDSGRPYFVMEVVRGIPLTDYCDQNHLAVPERLELFVQICQAVEHAHQKGIIHRDLKPAHVLVTLSDGVPMPKIIDFGIAKATRGQLTEKTLYTGYGQMIGTPLYMSPEQAEFSGVDVDTRSDIYSLGVVLYELLTGSTPFDQERVREAGYDEIRRMIREQDPPRPSTRMSVLSRSRLPGGTQHERIPGEHVAPGETSARSSTLPGPARQAGPTQPEPSLATIAANRQTDPAKLTRLLRRDLDWIVMKALEKDRARRYQTASDFARDIQRYLHDEPIEARPPTLADRAAKWARRHRAFVWFSIALLIAASIILAISTFLVLRERAETIRQRDEVLAREATLRRQAYAADVAWAWRAWRLGELDRARELLLRHQPAAGQEDVRSFVWHYLWNLCQSASTTLRGHTADVYHVAFSPDGKTLASGGKDRTIVLWDRATGQKRATLSGHSDDVNYIAFSRDGKLMATADEGYRDINHPEPKVILWDPVGGRLLKRITGFEFPVALALFLPDAKTLVAAEVYWPDGRSKTTLWDVSTGQRKKMIDGQRALALTPDGRTLATSSPDGKVRLWDLVEHQERAAVAGHDKEVLAGAFSPDGKLLATGARDRLVKLWNVADLQQEPASLYGHLGVVRSLAFSPDGELLASAGDDIMPRIWDVKTRSLRKVLTRHTDRVHGVAFSPEGNALATASSDQTIKLWDMRQITGRTTLPHKSWVWSLAFLPSGETIATACGEPRCLLWNVRTGDPEGAIDLPGRSVDFVATVPGKQVLATRASDGTVYTHDLARRTEPVPIAAHPTGVQVLSLSPDGQLFVTEGTDDSVRLWETATGNPLFSFRPTTTSGVGKSLGYCVFSPDGQTLAVRRGNEVHLLDIASKSLRILATRHSSCVRSLAYSPDGTILATGGDERLIKFFDTSTWQERAVLVGHHDPVTALAFSPDGKTLASGGETGEVRLWDVFTTEELFSLPGHTGTVWCVAFSPDGTCLATGGVVPEHTGETILWRAPRNKE